MAKAPAKKADSTTTQTELLHETKRDINPYWSSSLFSDVYLKNDLPRVYKDLWENDEVGDFANFYQSFLNLCSDLEHESFENWREADTVKNWIVPVMSLLGWENNSERHQNSFIDNTSFTIEEKGKKQVYRPDLIYFDRPEHKAYTQREKDNASKLREVKDKKSGAKIVVEAKYWNRLSTNTDKFKTKENDDSAVGLGPELQTMKYMELFDHDFGILTDGKTWKLFHKEMSTGSERRCYEFDLGNLKELASQLNHGNNEQKYRNFSKYFYYFFSKESIVRAEKSPKIPLVYEVLEYSKRYAHSIEEDLKKRFIITMGIACNSLKNSVTKSKETLDLELIRNVCESHLFNILFVKSCEVRRILPINSLNYLKVSLHEVIESLNEMNFDPEKNRDEYLRDLRFGDVFGGKKFTFEGHDIYDRFINLYEIIHDGTAASKDFGFEIEGFKESIFSKAEWKFAKSHKINNHDMLMILFNLNFIESSFPQRKYQLIPYSYFTPRQLGSIYESFLDYKLETAETNLVFTRGQWKEANLASTKVKKMKLADEYMVKKGELFFSPNNEDRKMTGAFYTPDHIVRYILQCTLDDTCEKLSSKEILKLKICDPAMGSGHFLSGTIDYLNQKYREKLSDEQLDDVQLSYHETGRTILDSCIYGIDINPRAVKLAKMSLWLITAMPGKKLECLDDQLFAGNSLNENEFSWKKNFDRVFKQGKFDLIIGNPPYVFVRGGHFSEEEKEYYKSFVTGEGKLNSFSLFFERCWKLINDENGRLSFICPSNILRTTTYANLREYIAKHCGVREIAIPDHHVFEGVTAETLIVTLEKGANNDSVPVVEFDTALNKKMINQVSVTSYLNNTECVYSVNVDKTSQEIFTKLTKKGEYLEELTDYIIEGIVTTKGKDKFISNKKLNSNYRKFLEGKDTGPYLIDYQNRFINYDKKVLHRARSVEVFEAEEKVLIQRISGGHYPLKASYDSEQYYTYASINNIILKDEYKKWHKYLCALLNSNLLNYYYGMNFTNFSSLTVNIAGAYLEKLPIYFDESILSEVNKCVDAIIKKGKVESKSSEKINELFYKSYGLTKKEIDTIEGFYKKIEMDKAA